MTNRVGKLIRKFRGPTLSESGQEFFTSDIADLVESDVDIRMLSFVFEGLTYFLGGGQLPKSQLLQDAFAAGVISRVGSRLSYLEIGGGHPVKHSNTWALDASGWVGVVVEPNQDFYTQYSGLRTACTSVTARAVVPDAGGLTTMEFVGVGELSYISEVGSPPNDAWKGLRRKAVKDGLTSRVPIISALELWNETVAQIGIPSYLSIDIEGLEIPILRKLPLSDVRPTVITVETSQDARRIVETDEILLSQGFVRVLAKASRWDNWYVDSSAYSKLMDSLR